MSGEQLTSKAALVPDHLLLRQIGKGAYGEVWLARSTLGSLRAIKIIWREDFAHSKPYDREFRGIEQFEPISRQHEALVDILQVGRNEEAGCFYYVMELADPSGCDDPASYAPRSLAAELKKNGPMPVSAVASLGASLAEGLIFLHGHGLVHRDIKPANILFVGGRPKFGDVGLVTQIGGEQSFVGTEGFIAPEGPGTAGADIFALGLVLYEAATGLSHHDFPQLPAALVSSPEVDDFAELNAVLLRACDPRPERRYADAAPLRKDLEALTDGRSVRRLRQLEARLRALRRWGISIAMLAVFLATGWFWQQRQAAAARADADREAAQVNRMAAKEQELRLNLYAADLSQAGEAIRAGNLGRARELLSNWKESPDCGEVRDAAWLFLTKAAQGDSHREFRGHVRNVSGLARDDRGQSIFSCGFDGTLREWNLSSGESRVLAEKAGEPFYEICRLGPDDFLLAGGSASWRWRNGLWISLGQGAARHLARGDGWVAVGGKTQFFGEDKPVEILALDGSGRIRELSERSGRVAVSEDGEWLVTGEHQGRLSLYATRSWDRIAEWEVPGQVVTLTFSPDQRYLAAGLREGGVVVWNVATKATVLRQNAHGRQVVWCVAFSPDGKRLASGGSDQSIHLWDVEAGRLERVLHGHEDEVWALSFSNDGRQLASSGKDEALRSWPLDTPEAVQPPDRVAGRVIFSPGGDWIACAEKAGGLRVLESASLKVIAAFPSDEVPLRFDGETLLTTPRGVHLNRWNVRTGEKLETRRLADVGSSGDRVVMSADGAWLAMVLADSRLVVWSSETGQVAYLSTQNEALVHEVAFSTDGKWLAVSHNDFAIRLMRTNDWRNAVTIRHHKMRTAGLSFSPDGDRLASASWDGTAAVFSVSDGRLLRTFRGHTTSLQDAVFLEAGDLLAVLEGDASVSFWDLRTGRTSGRLPIPLEENNHNLMASPDGRMLISTCLSGSRPSIWRASLVKSR